jgi:hypothetical protein
LVWLYILGLKGYQFLRNCVGFLCRM